MLKKARGDTIYIFSESTPPFFQIIVLFSVLDKSTKYKLNLTILNGSKSRPNESVINKHIYKHTGEAYKKRVIHNNLKFCSPCVQ